MFNNITASYDSSDASWEIIIMLLIAFILGFILRHLLGCKSEAEKKPEQKAKSQVKKKEAIIKTETQPKIKNLTRVELAIREMKRENKILAAMPSLPVPKEIRKQISKPESLQQVEGIGPKIEGLLHVGGILTMRELATADLYLVQDILTAAGPHYTVHSPKTWATQAELIADRKWDALKKYQDFLVGGREPES